MSIPFVDSSGERPGFLGAAGPPVVRSTASASGAVEEVRERSRKGQSALRFGDFVLDREASRLLGPDGEVHLRPQAFRLLEVLIEGAPRVLSQGELLDRVWGVEHLSPTSVKQAVSEVRQTLGDDPAEPRLIETVHRRGYRFIAPLRPVESVATIAAPSPVPAAVPVPARRLSRRFSRQLALALAIPGLAGIAGIAGVTGLGLLGQAAMRSPLPAAVIAPPPAAPGTAPARRTVAVIGFRNLSAAPQAAWISGALSEILGFELAAPGRLRVIPGENVARMRRELALVEETPSPASLHRIGQNLGTDFVVLGSYLLSDGDRLRLQVLVQDVRTGDTVAWARETGAADDLNVLATAAARGVLGSLADGPAGGPSAEAVALAANAESLRLYSAAQDRLRLWDGAAAARLLEGAVRIDPENPFATDSLATAYAVLGFNGKAKESAERALTLAARARIPPESRLAIEGRAHEVHGEWAEAAASYAALWQLSPDDLEPGLHLAYAQRKDGQTRESLATIAALRRLAPPAGTDPRIDLTESEAAWQLGDFARARDSAARGIEKAEARRAALLIAAGELSRGWAFTRLGDKSAALADFRAARGLYQRMGDRGGAAGMLVAEATVLQAEGDTAAARRAFEAAIPVFREIGDRGREAKSLNNFAVLLNEEGDFAGIEPLLERSLAIKREIGDLQGTALTLVNLGNLLRERGETGGDHGARPRFEEAIGISRRLGDAHGTALALRGLSRLHAGEGRFDDGRAALAEALAASRKSGDAEGAAQAALALGDLERKAGRAEPARAAYRQAIGAFTAIEETSNAATALVNLAEVDVTAGRLDAARAGYAEALELALALESPVLEAHARYGLGLTAARRGDPRAARGEYEEALALFVKLAEKDEAAKARKALASLK
jgi:DNA-binding winged helix-turn-helix (wHTH) protein/tetratricopeptide (TPR) repeat protein/TolB-like protein